MTGSSLHGLAAEFERAEDLEAAVTRLRQAGYTRLDAYAPHPLPDLAEPLGLRTAPLAWIAAGAGLVGACVQYGAQVWFNVIDYPIDVGGRPLHAWPAFLPATLIVTILWTGATTLLAMLAILGLPRLHHPIFAVPGFERASQDRYFLCLRAVDPRFDEERARTELEALRPLRVSEVPE